MEAKRLSDLVSVRGRFHRSVNLARDWKGGRDLSEYIVTPAIEEIAGQILEELVRVRGARAWSLTGPYGTGKSAFALFLADVLGSKPPAHEAGRALRTAHMGKRKPFLPVLLQAERAPLAPVLLDALSNEVSRFSRPLATQARRLRERGTSGEAVAAMLLEAAAKAGSSGFGGLAVLVDEFGKYLEFAAADPQGEDVFLVQQLAEAASRSEVPILFLTVLHAGFADYLPHVDGLRKAEWQKVQGRFRDIPFQLPAEQLLALVAHALDSKFSNGIEKSYRHRLGSIVDSKALAPVVARGRLRRLLPACLPLHPMAALVLWPLFRSKAAQNERSLFAFLTSHEPRGLQEFLESSEASASSAPLYGLADLYDYVASALGLAAFSGTDSRRWAVIDQALQRIPASAPSLAKQIVKCIGLLAQYGEAVGLRPTGEILRLAIERNEQFDDVLAALQHDSIVIYRRHSDSFGLWEGSDLDLDACVAEARDRIARVPLHERIEHAFELRPLVARAHYVKTGTLRFFEASVVDGSPPSIDRALKGPTSADGRILFVVGVHGDAEARGLELSKLIDPNCFALVAVPRIGPGITDALEEFECWRWVRDHVRELAGDAVARQEVHARLEAARRRLDQIAGPALGAAGHALDPSLSTWAYRGERLRPTTPRSFQKLLSERCEEVFSSAPPLRNELLNRHNLSSAAAKARRILLERMVENPQLERLGIQGFPPEFSMYAAMLLGGGFHGSSRGRRLCVPTNATWKPIWTTVQLFLDESRRSRRPLQDLIALLKAPPFGMRDGPIPILLAAALLVNRDEVALYEDGVFVPDFTIEVFERLTRRPETFEVQSYRLSSSERALLETLSRVVYGGDGESDALIAVVKGLVHQVAALTPYVKQTRRLANRTCAARDALLNATDPKALLFHELPAALGIDLETPEGPKSFAKALRKATLEMARAQEFLLEQVEARITKAFGVAASGRAARAALRARSLPLVRAASDPKLQVFVREATKEDDRDWREVLARAVNEGKPPPYWRDEDVASFPLKLDAIAVEFDRLEELVAVAGETDTTVVSIGILERRGAERRTIVSAPAERSKEVQRLVDQLYKSLGQSKGADRRSMLIALASLACELSRETTRNPE